MVTRFGWMTGPGAPIYQSPFAFRSSFPQKANSSERPERSVCRGEALRSGKRDSAVLGWRDDCVPAYWREVLRLLFEDAQPQGRRTSKMCGIETHTSRLSMAASARPLPFRKALEDAGAGEPLRPRNCRRREAHQRPWCFARTALARAHADVTRGQ